MRIEILPSAIADLAEIDDYLKARNPAAAKRVLAHLRNRIFGLSDFPYRFRAGAIEGTRERVDERYGYIIVYAVDEDEDAVRILSIFHGAQDRPRGPAAE